MTQGQEVARIMRVVGVGELLGPDVVAVMRDRAETPGPDEVRIRVVAATINPTDFSFLEGRRAHLLTRRRPPFVAGMECSGVVESVGEGVTDLAAGDRVMAIANPYDRRGGAQKALLVAPRESVLRTPAKLSSVQAATIPMNGLSAVLALDTLASEPGTWLWITGAAGALGGYVAQLASSRGLRTVVDVAEKDRSLMASLGVSIVVPRGDRAAQRVVTAVGARVAAVIDAAQLGSSVLPAVQDGGMVVSVRPTREFTDVSTIQARSFLVGEHTRDRRRIAHLQACVDAGLLTPRVARAVPAHHAREAYRLARSPGLRSRVVLQFDSVDATPDPADAPSTRWPNGLRS